MPFQIPIFFPQIYDMFGINSYMPQMAMQILVLISLIVVFFRIILCAGYQNIYAVYKLQAKEVAKKEDIEKIKHGFFSRVVKAYVPILEKGANYISSKDIVEKEFGRTRFLFLKFRSIIALITTFENSILLISVILAIVFAQENGAAAIAGIALFVVVKLFSMVFDYNTVKEKTLVEMSNYIEVEIGKFYAKDTVSSINLLRIEIKNSMKNQSNMFKDSINKFCIDLSNTMEKSMMTLSGRIDDTMNDVLRNADALNEPLEKWRSVIFEAAKSQETFNNTIAGLSAAIGDIERITSIADGGFNKIADKMSGYYSGMSNQTEQLIQITSALKDSNNNYIIKNDEIVQQLKYLKSNQQALDTSLQQYELTLKEMTSQIGGGIGKIIDFHMQGAYNAMNERLQENLKVVINSNNELINRLQTLFAQMQEQSKSETNAILSIKEQMDINFNSK